MQHLVDYTQPVGRLLRLWSIGRVDMILKSTTSPNILTFYFYLFYGGGFGNCLSFRLKLCGVPQPFSPNGWEFLDSFFLRVKKKSRIKWYYFLPENLKWSGDNKHPTRPHTILKNKKAKNGERSSVFVFFSIVWGRVGWSVSPPLHLNFFGK